MFLPEVLLGATQASCSCPFVPVPAVLSLLVQTGPVLQLESFQANDLTKSQFLLVGVMVRVCFISPIVQPFLGMLCQHEQIHKDTIYWVRVKHGS